MMANEKLYKYYEKKQAHFSKSNKKLKIMIFLSYSPHVTILPFFQFLELPYIIWVENFYMRLPHLQIIGIVFINAS